MSHNNLMLDIVNVTEQAAIAAFKLAGIGDEKAADKAAVDAMRSALNQLPIKGTIVIGEGERDEAPMLYIGEEVGTGCGPELDIALDPLEGTTLCAKYQANALSVIAIAKKGNLLYAPDVYMQKIAISDHYPKDIINIEASVTQNILALAKAKNTTPEQLVICIMDRERHQDIIQEARCTGAKIKLISDGDVSAVIETAQGKIDLYLGTGGAPEGVLASAALRCLGGQMFGRLILDTPEKCERAKKMGIAEPNKIYSAEEMAKGDVIFCATGVTNGSLLKAVDFKQQYGQKIITTHNMVTCSKHKTTFFIEKNTQIL